jgi:hypothetical protein
VVRACENILALQVFFRGFTTKQATVRKQCNTTVDKRQTPLQDIVQGARWYHKIRTQQDLKMPTECVHSGQDVSVEPISAPCGRLVAAFLQHGL